MWMRTPAAWWSEEDSRCPFSCSRGSFCLTARRALPVQVLSSPSLCYWIGCGFSCDLVSPLPFSVEELRYLTDQLQKVRAVNEANQDVVIEALRSIAEIMIYGDQHDPSFFEYFVEKQIMDINWFNYHYLYMHR